MVIVNAVSLSISRIDRQCDRSTTTALLAPNARLPDVFRHRNIEYFGKDDRAGNAGSTARRKLRTIFEQTRKISWSDYRLITHKAVLRLTNTLGFIVCYDADLDRRIPAPSRLGADDFRAIR